MLHVVQERRHERTLKALAADIPAAVADNLSQPLGGIRHKVDGIADDVALANRQLTYLADGARGKRGAGDREGGCKKDGRRVSGGGGEGPGIGWQGERGLDSIFASTCAFLFPCQPPMWLQGELVVAVLA